MSVVVFQSLDKLRATVEAAIPTLVGKVRPVSADAMHAESMPAMAFVPRDFDPTFGSAIEVSKPTSSTQLMQVGEGRLRVEVRIGHRHPAQREALQEQFTALFLADPDAPGTISLLTAPLTIQGFATGYQAPCSYELANWEWNEERVFETARFVFMEMEILVPILYLRGATAGTEVYTIAAIQLQMTRDLTTTPNAAATNLVTDETVQVNADGRLVAPTAFP